MKADPMSQMHSLKVVSSNDGGETLDTRRYGQ